MSKPILRKCLITNNYYSKDKLIRLVYLNNQLLIEPKTIHKGIYILNSSENLQVINNKTKLERAIKKKISNYEQISKLLKEIMEVSHG